MANTNLVLEGVKEYTLELLGTKARDESVAAADRSEAAATRSESAATRVEGEVADALTEAAGLIRDEVREDADRAEGAATAAETAVGSAAVDAADAVRLEVKEDADRAEAAATEAETTLANKADKDHTHTSADITDANHYIGGSDRGDRVVKTYSNGHIYSREDPPAPNALARRQYVDDQVAGKADADHTHTAAEVGARPASWTPTASDVGARPVTWTPTAEQVGAATPDYVDSRVREVTGDAWPSSPEPGVIYWQAE